jgi:hypothetical protein
MNRYLTFFTMSIITLAGFVALQHVALADTEGPMTEPHIARIRQNCVEAQSSLFQIHASDALLRVNRGQLYESISTKLMAPLNSRIALNKLDGGALVSITLNYEKTLNDFRTDYQVYELSLSQVLNIKCTDQPVSFYDGVRAARDARSKVHNDVLALQDAITKYRAAFEAFSSQVTKGSTTK